MNEHTPSYRPQLPPVTAETPVEDVKQRIMTEVPDYMQDRFFKVLDYPPEVYTTAEYAIPDKQLNYKGGVILGPNFGMQLLAIAFVAGLITDIIESKYHPPFHPYVLFHPILLFLALFGIGYLIFRQIKPLNRKIKLDNKGILLYDDRFEWSQIIGTYVLLTGPKYGAPYAGGGGSGPGIPSFVLVDSQGNFHEYKIFGLSVSPKMFCTLVEYYRTKNQIG